MIISNEQNEIIQNMKNGTNVLVDACAGSGKSTTIISLAKAMPDKKIIQITYNSMLRYEFKEKAKNENIKNIEIHTYHSLAVKYFSPNAHTDSGLRRLLYSKLEPLIPIPDFDITVVDEAQDMTFLYYQFIVYFISKIKGQFQILILGDYMQGLYEFKGADTRFLTQGQEIWTEFPKLSSNNFIKCTLKTSYRVTNQMASYVNEVMLGERRLYAVRDGPKVMYIRNNNINIPRIVAYNIKQLLSNGAKPGDIFVLGSSVKGATSKINEIENIISNMGIPCLVPMLETDQPDERIVSGKIVFSTYHSVKGRQRKHVFIVGFDNNYMTSFYADTSGNCPNTLYVACTRATETLTLIEMDNWATDRPLYFLKKTHLEMKNTNYIDFKGIPKNIFWQKTESAMKLADAKPKKINTTPTEMVHFLSESVVEELSPILDRIFILESDNQEGIEIPSIIETTEGIYEDVSDINGIAIPCMYYDYIQKNSVFSQDLDQENRLYQMIKMGIADFKSNKHTYLTDIFHTISPICEKMGDYLYMANVLIAVQEKLYFKLKQIPILEYNWISAKIVDQCMQRMDKIIGNSGVFETPEIEKTIIKQSYEFEHIKIDQILGEFLDINAVFRFTARTDILMDTVMWEIKCTSRTSVDHMLQVVIYAWLLECIGTPKICKIINIKTGEIYRLDATFDEMTQIVVAILKSKYGKEVKIANADFIENCRKVWV